MRLSVDQSQDYSNKELFSYLRDAELPGYVKTAEVDTTETITALPKTAFADPRGYFPINTPARTYVSNAYFINKKAALAKEWSPLAVEKIEAKIKEAADLFGITEDIEAYSSKSVKTASESYNEEYLYEAQVGDDTFHLFPVKTAADLTKTAESFVSNINKYPYNWRFDICNNFVKKAKELGVDELPDLVCKYAGMFFPDVPKIKTEVWRRSTKLASEVNKGIYNTLIADMDNNLEMSDIQKIADICYTIEESEGLYENTKTAELLPDPIDVFFTMDAEKAVKIASEYVLVAGEQVPMDYVIKNLDSINKVAGTDMTADDVDGIRDIMPTLPLGDWQAVKQLVR